ncbi:MAG: 16S rRNA (guanine(966)-N(2))-methyltransferase RsmD [Firmicutes bacterium]|nr:16S rRNA (guanine(966)-N(2))-methyltransferase RsmD [Bacillota bacterium]
MRVIAGTARGTRLKVPRGGAVRPTSDRVKEALFNILGLRVFEAVVWDLYAGSGAIGIEALSRGAAEALFVEQERAHLKIIEENLSRARVASRARLLQQDVKMALPLLAREKQQADLIFSDPPYQERTIPTLLAAIDHYGLLHADGLIVLELFARSELWPEKHPAVNLRKYGDTVLAFIEAAALPQARAALSNS